VRKSEELKSAWDASEAMENVCNVDLGRDYMRSGCLSIQSGYCVGV